jgi:amino acid adenylation domain-containing protein
MRESVEEVTSRRLVQLDTDFPRAVGVDGGERQIRRHVVGQWSSIADSSAFETELVAGLSACLQRYTGQASIALDVLRAAGARVVRTLALDTPVDLEQTFASLTERVAQALGVAESDSTQLRSNVAIASGGVAVDGARYELSFIVQPSGFLEILYDAAIFAPATIARLAESFDLLLRAARDAPESALHSLPVLSAAVRRDVEVTWDSGPAVGYVHTPVVQLFQAIVRERPHDIAVHFGSEQLDYVALDAESSRLAHYLLAHGVRPGGAVAVCVAPSFDIVVAMLAIFKVGALYVPLDPTHPEKLIAGMLDEARPQLVLTQSRVLALTLPGRFAHVCLDLDRARWQELPPSGPEVALHLDLPAYLFFTSGTTGKPKGVLGTQRNLAHYIQAGTARCGFRAGDAFISLARYTFTISLFELLIPLCSGGCTRLVPRDQVLAPQLVAELLRDVSVLHAGPSMLGNLLRYVHGDASAPRAFPSVRHVSTGGDLVPPHLLEQLKPVFPNAELFVIYGSTETTPMSSIYEVDRATKVTRSFVGMPFADVALRVLDVRGQLVPVGAVGEICFAGMGLAREYLARPDLTTEKFFEHEGRRYYHTGDMGRLHADGTLEILGRRDFQVKLRGIRIELGGIENMVRELGLAAQCAVVVKSLDEHDQRLVAFVVNPRETSSAAFRRALAAHLPTYMLPQSVVALDALPVTVNGKLDRRELQNIPWQVPTATITDTESLDAYSRRIAAAFASALRQPEVGLDDDFFDLGGHSLLAVRVMREIEDTLGVSLPAGVLFEHPTVRSLVASVQTASESERRPILLNDSDGPALFLMSGVYLYRDLANQLEGQYAVYGVYSPSELQVFGSGGNQRSVTELAAEYCQIIRRVQAQGPYRLAGLSFGGVVAFEVAQQLTSAGESVTFLGVLDSKLPDSGWFARLEQVGRLASVPTRTLVHALTRRARLAVANVSSMVLPERATPSASIVAMEDLREHAYYRAVADYVKERRMFDGKVTLILAADRMAGELAPRADSGWTEHVQSLAIHTLACDHLDVVKSPFAARVAEIFLAALGGA